MKNNRGEAVEGQGCIQLPKKPKSAGLKLLVGSLFSKESRLKLQEVFLEQIIWGEFRSSTRSFSDMEKKIKILHKKVELAGALSRKSLKNWKLDEAIKLKEKEINAFRALATECGDYARIASALETNAIRDLINLKSRGSESTPAGGAMKAYK